MWLTGPISPSSSTTRGQAYSLAASGAKFKHLASLLGLDGSAKKLERGIAVTNDVGKPRWWLLITSSTNTDATKNIFDYVVDAYESALGKATTGYLGKLTGISMKARNSCEEDNTTSVQAGHAVSPSGTNCKDKIGIHPIRNFRVPCWDIEQISGTDAADPANWRFIFSMPNDARYYGEPS